MAMQKRLRWLFMVVLFTLFAPDLAASDTIAVLHDPDEKGLDEAYKSEVPVSGRVLSGILLTGKDIPNKLAVFPQQVESQAVCVQVLSRDGRYWSENTFILPESTISGPISLQYESKYPKILNTLGLKDLAILTRPGDCTNSSKNHYLVSARNQPKQLDPSLLLFINSSRSDTYVRIMNRSSKTKTRKCERIKEGRRTGYDTICRIMPVPTLTEDDSMLRLKVYRRQFEKNLKPLEIAINLP